MTGTEAKMDPTLFDPRAREAETQHPHSRSVPSTDEPDQAEATPVGENVQDKRKRIEKQLDALMRKEAELRRALLVAEHPEVGDAIGAIEGRAFALARAEEKAGLGLSKSVLRRRETIEKKLSSLREKRAELDTQIGTLEQELTALGSEQHTVFEAERRAALMQLLIALSTHAPALSAVGLDAHSLVPERWLPEIEAIAREVSTPS